MPPTEFSPHALISEMMAVWRLAIHLCTAKDAERFVQEVYMRAFTESHEVSATMSRNPRLWLFRICWDVSRAHPTGFPDIHDQSPPIPQSLRDPVDARLQTAICKLPMVERMIFILSIVERLKYQDIAEVVREPEPFVIERLAAAHRQVAEGIPSA